MTQATIQMIRRLPQLGAVKAKNKRIKIRTKTKIKVCTGNQPKTSTPTASAADTSFSAAMAQYAVKLIYLPNYSQPMALRMRYGLLGTVSAAPTLQDG
jgi:hypothetical protein